MGQRVRFRNAVRALAILAPMPFLVGCATEDTLRYEITVSVLVGDKVIEGSAVEQTRVAEQLVNLGSPVYVSFKGQAIKVDLGTRGMLFVLLVADENRKNAPWEMRYAPMYYFPAYFKDGSPQGMELFPRIAQWKKDKPCAKIPIENLPLLVRFRDISDHRSVEYVDVHNLEEKFGPSVRLLSATICYSYNTVKIDLANTLPWLNADETKPFALNPEERGGPGRIPQIKRLGLREFLDKY